MNEKKINSFILARTVVGFDNFYQQGDMRVIRVDLPDGGNCVSGRIRTNPDNLLLDVRKVWAAMEVAKENGVK